MAWFKNAETKSFMAKMLKAGAAISSAALLFACGDDSGSTSTENDNREVATLVDMGRCTVEREGDTVYVAEKLTDYLCHNSSWVDITGVSNTGDNPAVNPGIDPVSSSSANKKTDADDNLVVKKRSILGVAQKGPFKFGSPVYLRELSEDNLDFTGVVYEDEISSNKGDFVIPNVNLTSPYASVEVNGLYRNEITGEYSKSRISLFALTDLKTAVTDSKDDERNKVNVNLLTHLEYSRAVYLVRNKGYSVYAAKKQADQEIMTAFELPTTVKYSEDLSVFEDSEDDNVDYANASLMMLNLLFLGNRTDAEIHVAINNFIVDFEKDGSWDDASTKAAMADFANEVNVDDVRANVKAWNILSIPMFETQLEMFWNNVYGLGGCSDKRKGVVAQNTNKLSKYYEKYFICNSAEWVDVTTFEKDTYEWAAGKEGEFKKGNVTDSVYGYNGSKWEFAERETAIGICGKNNAGKVSEFKEVYYICKDNAWTKATALEYDTYGWKAGKEGDVKAGSVNKNTFYVYENGAWRASANALENSLGACVTSREGEVGKSGSAYYICKSKSWTTATELEYDKMTDTRDGQVYKTVVIGKGANAQTWMAENLNFEYNKGTAKSYCYNNSADSCAKYGRLYTWAAAMDSVTTKCGYGKTCSTSGTIQGVCPDGWHLPSKAEWETLFANVGGKSTAGIMLKSTSGWKNSGDGKNFYGFSALPAGYRDYNGNFNSAGSRAHFWSSSEYSSSNAYYVDLYCDDEGAYLVYSNKSNAFSVRCLKDSN